MTKRLAMFGAALLLAGCVAEPLAVAPSALPSPSALPNTAPTVQPTPAPLVLTGTGQTASESFVIAGGMTVFHLEHSGSSNFAVWLLDAQGEKKDLLANEIGSFKGSKGIGLTAGSYLLDVKADGPWSVRVEQPRPGTAAAPGTINGTGATLAGPFQLSGGLARFRMTHDGGSNFAVWLLDHQGAKKDLLANEIGAFTGSKATSVAGGVVSVQG